MNERIETAAKWTFLTNHAHILLCLSKFPAMRMRDLAIEVGITERAVQRIVSDLAEEGYIKVARDGRCNTYSVNGKMHLKHPLEAHREITDLTHLVFGESDEGTHPSR